MDSNWQQSGMAPSPLGAQMSGEMLAARARAVAAWKYLEGMPEDLAGGELMMSEVEIETALPVPMHGRVDQVYRSANGLVVPVDSKLRGRARVEPGDIVQLSVYGFILRHGFRDGELGGAVAPYGYVRAAMGVRAQYLPVRLLNDEAMIAIYNRWVAVRDGVAGQVRFSVGGKTCGSCAGRDLCLPRGKTHGEG